MATSQNFRNAFNGFNREDVVHYLEYINSRHTALVNQLTEEVDSLRSKLNLAAEAVAADSRRMEQIAALEAEQEDLRRQLEASEAARQSLGEECIALRAQLEAAQTPASAEDSEALLEEITLLRAENACLKEELEQTKAAPAAVPAVSAEKELEAYRRAERVERMARERADQLYRQTNGVLAEASMKVDQVAADIGTIADQVTAQLQQLQEAVTGSKQALQGAADLMFTLRPENEEI